LTPASEDIRRLPPTADEEYTGRLDTEFAEKGARSVKRIDGWSVVVALCALFATALLTWAAIAIAQGNLEVGFDTLLGSLAVSGIAVLLIKMRTAPTLGVDTDGVEITVRFHGWDRLWTLRRSASVPLASVRSVSVSRLECLLQHTGRYPRHRGTILPGLIRAGTSSTNGGAELWDVRAGAGNVLCIDLDDQSPYERMVLQVPDPEVARDALNVVG
jgi:hypothetical protein